MYIDNSIPMEIIGAVLCSTTYNISTVASDSFLFAQMIFFCYAKSFIDLEMQIALDVQLQLWLSLQLK
jgi:hypothetical protein